MLPKTQDAPILVVRIDLVHHPVRRSHWQKQYQQPVARPLARSILAALKERKVQLYHRLWMELQKGAHLCVLSRMVGQWIGNRHERAT